MRWCWKTKPRESPELERARAERKLTEQQLEEARADREYVNQLAERAEKALRVNGFGAAATTAMKRRRHA